MERGVQAKRAGGVAGDGGHTTHKRETRARRKGGLERDPTKRSQGEMCIRMGKSGGAGGGGRGPTPTVTAKETSRTIYPREGDTEETEMEEGERRAIRTLANDQCACGLHAKRREEEDLTEDAVNMVASEKLKKEVIEIMRRAGTR